MELILQVIFSSVFSGFMLSVAIPNEFYLFGCPIYTLAAFIPLYLIFNKIRDFKTAFLAFFLLSIWNNFKAESNYHSLFLKSPDL